MKRLLILVVMFIMIFSMTGFADTDTPTPTATYTATPSLFEVRVIGYTAWLADAVGDTDAAVANYRLKATAQLGRNDLRGEAQANYSAGHSLIKKFNSTSLYNQSLKTIRLILTPSAQATAGSLYATTLTTSYTPLLDDAEIYMGYAAVITGTSEAAANATSNKIEFDVERIEEVRDWITDHL